MKSIKNLISLGYLLMVLLVIGIMYIWRKEWYELEKARVIDPFGHAGLTPLGEIRMTLAGEIKMTPVEASAGEFFCSFETPCPGTAGINLKNYRI